MDETLDTLGRTIAGAVGPSVTGYAVAHGELTITGQASEIVPILRFLRDDSRCLFWCLIDITAVDWPSRERRFDVVRDRVDVDRRDARTLVRHGALPPFRPGCAQDARS